MTTCPARIALALAFAGSMAAQQTDSGSARTHPIVRAITVLRVSTSKRGLPEIPFTAIQNAWNISNVGVAVQLRLDGDSIERAENVIQSVYKAEGASVRVEHEVTQMPPRSSVEVKFRVIELCSCD